MGHRALLTAASCLLLAMSASCASTPESASEDPSINSSTAEARALFADIGEDDPFCSAAVLSGDEVVFADAFGSDDDGPVTTETEVDIASVSKQFTGVAIELLIDSGDLDGSDLVGELVPDSSPATDDITVDELLTHTSGLTDYGDLLPQEPDEPASQADAVAAIAESEPTEARGTHDYSNSNYVLLAEVVEAVSGRPLPEFLADEVFDPLDLAMAVDPAGAWTQVGDGSIWTTPTEVVTWSTEYWDQTLDGPDLAEVMFDPEVEITDEDDPMDWYGSGIGRSTTDDGDEAFLHDGSWDGYETDWVILPDEQLAAAVTCAEGADAPDDPATDLLAIWR